MPYNRLSDSFFYQQHVVHKDVLNNLEMQVKKQLDITQNTLQS